MDDKKAAARAVIVGELEAAIDIYDKKIGSLKNVLLGEGYIVMVAGRGVAFKIVDKMALSPSSVRVDMAPRFTKRDAEMLASGITNGNGEKAKAVHIVEALMGAIEECSALRASILGA